MVRGMWTHCGITLVLKQRNYNKVQDKKLREHASGITCYKGNEHNGRNPTAWWMLGISESANSKKLNQFKKTTRFFERLGICQNTLAVVTVIVSEARSTESQAKGGMRQLEHMGVCLLMASGDLSQGTGLTAQPSLEAETWGCGGGVLAEGTVEQY